MPGGNKRSEGGSGDRFRGDLVLLTVSVVLIGGALALAGEDVFSMDRLIELLLVGLASAAILVLSNM